ncbi:hypothetical protein J1614_009466 [Plenodomus biglobosus]|nr:hypothetical protein J1614_009466 [Plenodomus biglobosus]
MRVTASLLTTLLSTIPSTLSALAPSPQGYTSPEPYNCGYVLTEHNSSSSASLPALNGCAPIYYNYSLPGYQEAWAYLLYGGCRCSFFREVNDCLFMVDPPLFEGPTRGGPGDEALFVEPMPRWFNCSLTA